MSQSHAIAIDGPAAAGKSTVAKLLAKKLNYTYIDTGAMYRTLTLQAIHDRIDLHDAKQLASLLEKTEISLKQDEAKEQIVLLNGEDVTLDIRSQKVTNSVSHVAKHREVRKRMVKLQQSLAKANNVVMDGRDIGTYVLPDAQFKFFLVASVEERAKRRYEENIQKGIKSDLKQLKDDIEQRDLLDTKRKIAPLVKASDAIELDTTSMTIDDVVQTILNYINQ